MNDTTETEMVANQQAGYLNRSAKLGLSGVVGIATLLLLVNVTLTPKKEISSASDMPLEDVTSLAEATIAIPVDKVEVDPPRAQCARIGESCKESNCCRWSGYRCFEKDATFSSCLKTCKPGQPNGDAKSTKPKFQKPKPGPNGEIPKYATAFFKPAPPGSWTCKRTPNLKSARLPRGTTLYCFVVALSKVGPGKAPKYQNPEQIDLVKTQHHTKTSIFGCEKWTVFSDVSFQLTPGPPKEIFSTVVDFPKPAVRPNTKLWVNTLLFVNVWKKVLADGHHANSDWTVKVDPTTIFLPIRLRKILKHQKQTYAGIYLENCKWVRYGFHGSLEVMDQRAAVTLANHAEGCLEELPWDRSEHSHFSYAGEDKFVQRCLEMKGVDRIPSAFELGMGAGLHTTITCPAHVPKKANKTKWYPPCNTTRTAAMHPYKKPKLYFTCLAETQLIDTRTDEEGQQLVGF